MNILIGTSADYEIGGVNSYMNTLKDTLQYKGYETSLLYPDKTQNTWKVQSLLKTLGNKDKARRELVEIRKRNIKRKIEHHMSRHNKTLIHAQDVIFANTVKDLDAPLILTVHGPTSREARMSNKAGKAYTEYLVMQEKRAFELADHIIAVDSGQKEIVVEDFGVDPDKITVILNSVDTDFFKPNSKLNTNNKNIFLVPRRLVPKNGVDIAIKSFEFLQNYNCELWIAGDGPQNEQLRRMVNERNLNEKVRFLGTVDRNKMVDLINQSTGVIIPSVPVDGVVEASSISALEGMSVGKIVIASNIGGLAELITDKENGLLFKSGDSRKLAELIKLTIEDVTFRKSLEKEARDTVIKNYSSKVWIEKNLQVYKRVVRDL